MPIVTGLSGHDIYCLRLKGLKAGEQVAGNTVHPVSVLGNPAAAGKQSFGAEVEAITEVLQEARQVAYERLVHEAKERGGVGVVAVDTACNAFEGHLEFVSSGSCVLGDGAAPDRIGFTTSTGGSDTFCVMDAGFRPLRFVYGNVAYATGQGAGFMASLKGLKRGEVKEFSDALNHSRRKVLKRIGAEARGIGANAIVGMQTFIVPFQGVHEMLVVGTAAQNPKLPPEFANAPATSVLSGVETWNMANLGYLPLRLVLSSAVYSFAAGTGLKAAFQSLKRGEMDDLTNLIYEAREQVLGQVADEARAIGAEEVVGVTHHTYEIGNLVEFLAVGTAVKRLSGVHTATATLPAQAMARERENWIRLDDVLGPPVAS